MLMGDFPKRVYKALKSIPLFFKLIVKTGVGYHNPVGFTPMIPKPCGAAYYPILPNQTGPKKNNPIIFNLL